MSKTHASLCTGFGAADLAAEWVGWTNMFWGEIDDFCREILKFWFPNSIGYGDITQQSFREWRYKIDVLTAGFPCQPFSVAGGRKGAEDHRYLWPTIKRIIHEVRPTWFIGENVNGIISMVQPGEEVKVESQAAIFEKDYQETILTQDTVIETICRDIECEGYSVQPILIPACAVGANHRRDRVFFIAYSNRYDARRRQFRETGCETGKMQSQQEKWERLRDDVERNDAQKIVAYSNSKRQSVRDKTNCRREISSIKERIQNYGKTDGLCSLWASTDTECSGWIQNYQSEFAEQLKQSIPDWRRAPTQSPVCMRNDGFSDLLDGITFPSWRGNSIKGFGNAIVPQEILEIFKVIDRV